MLISETHVCQVVHLKPGEPRDAGLQPASLTWIWAFTLSGVLQALIPLPPIQSQLQRLSSCVYRRGDRGSERAPSLYLPGELLGLCRPPSSGGSAPTLHPVDSPAQRPPFRAAGMVTQATGTCLFKGERLLMAFGKSRLIGRQWALLRPGLAPRLLLQPGLAVLGGGWPGHVS